jgi:hypothetical protein
MSVTRRVLLHVGTPKTGTSYLQDVLFRNRPLLAQRGIHYPADRFDGHFLAALDLMRLPWGGLEKEAVGAWDRLADAARDESGTIIVSHEILATASRTQVGRALESLGHGRDDTEVHVVLSVRDLVRQIPAEWQENVKHRRELTYRRFLDAVRDPDRASRIGTWFWGVQEIPDILNRWGHDLPPERIHLVTVPPPGSARGLLWERFARTFGLEGLPLDLTEERANPSLGVPETALVRRINVAANAELPPPDYRPLVRELLAHNTLSRRTSSARLTLPPDDQDWVRALQEAWIEEIEARGYDVCGSLADLRGPAPLATYADPDHPDEAEVADAAVDAIKALLLDNARLMAREAQLGAELHDTRLALDRARLRPSYRRREAVVRRLEAARAGRVLMRVYRRARGR